MKLTIITLFTLIFIGCKPDEKLSQLGQENFGGRFMLKRVGSFEDDLAPAGKRALYILVDRARNNTQYIGVSGVGMCEVRTQLNLE